jgi:hypothetical protein
MFFMARGYHSFTVSVSLNKHSAARFLADVTGRSWPVGWPQFGQKARRVESGDGTRSPDRLLAS